MISLNKPRLTALLLIIWWLIFIAALHSCRTVHKTSSVHTMQVDSTTITHNHAAAYSFSDSSVTEAINNAQAHDSSYANRYSVTLEFYKDSFMHSTSVTYDLSSPIFDLDLGHLPPVKSMTFSGETNGRVKDSIGNSSTKQADIHKSDSSSEIEDRYSNLKLKEVKKDTTKVKEAMPLLAVVGITIGISTLLMGIIFLALHAKKLKKVAEAGDQELKRVFK